MSDVIDLRVMNDEKWRNEEKKRVEKENHTWGDILEVRKIMIPIG